MKGRSQRLPAPAPPKDDWGDGDDSWTVDCSCGVNYDDGEEMVNCDDCGVWVHTRCSRYVKEEESFTCDKCKGGGGNRHAGSNSNEEAEVAELLAELPTKGDKCLPPPAPSNHIHRAPPPRVWFETPMEDRVHIQGLPGGDPSIFEGSAGSVFNTDLWNACGFIPKKFNFKYKEFRCWDNEEVDNPANTGADVLFSLSKETALPGPSMTLTVRKPDLPRDSGGKDGKGISPSGWLNPVKKERNKLRGFTAITTGKRKEEDPATIKEKAAKKARLSAKATLDEKAAGSSLGVSTCNSNASRDEPLKGSKSFLCDEHGVFKRKESPSDNGSKVHSNSKINGVKDSFKKAPLSKASPGNISSMASQEKSSERKHAKLENVHKQPPEVSSGRDVSTCLMHSEEHDSQIKEKDDYTDLDGLRENKQSFNLNVSSSSAASEEESCKPASNRVGNIDPDNQIPAPDLDKKLYSSCVSVKIENDTSWSGDGWSASKCQPSPITCSETEVKTALSFEGPSRHLPVSCQASSNTAYKNFVYDKDIEATTQTSNENLPTPEQRQEEPVSTSEVQEGSSNLVQGDHNAQESSRSGFLNSISMSPRGIKRACSSTEDIPELPTHMSDSSMATAAKIVTFQKRMKVNTAAAGENEYTTTLNPSRDNLQGETTSNSIKGHLKSSRSSSDKPSQSSKTNLLPAFKNISGDIKEHKHLSSSKASSTENSGSSSGSGKQKSSQVQSDTMPIKFRTSASHRKNEKNSSSSHTSNKASSNSVAAFSSTVSSSTLSDEELAKRLHQELNSSPRVSRAPRGFHASGMQLSSPGATSMLSKRSSSSNSIAKVHDSVSKKDSRRDGPNDSSGDSNLEHLQPSANKRQETKHANAPARRDSHGLLGEVPSVKKSGQPSSFSGSTMHMSSSNS